MIEVPEFRYRLAAISTFKDEAVCARVRAIPRARIAEHANPEFNISVIDERGEFYAKFALDLISRIRNARDLNQSLVVIFPVGPLPQYEIAADLINKEHLSLGHVHTFNMDEYADQDGNTAPVTWSGSFQRSMYEAFFSKISPELRPLESNIHFPTTEVIHAYSAMIDDLGGADVCYGGIGWNGHIAFWEPHLGFEFEGDLGAYRSAGARLVELHPMTIMQNALHSFGGDWSSVPPKANTIGPREILGAKHRSFWLDGDLGNNYSWQRFIARLVAHGPVSEFVPGSMLQQAGADYTLLGNVADDIKISMG